MTRAEHTGARWRHGFPAHSFIAPAPRRVKTGPYQPSTEEQPGIFIRHGDAIEHATRLREMLAADTKINLLLPFWIRQELGRLADLLASCEATDS